MIQVSESNPVWFQVGIVSFGKKPLINLYICLEFQYCRFVGLIVLDFLGVDRRMSDTVTAALYTDITSNFLIKSIICSSLENFTSNFELKIYRSTNQN